MPESASSSCSPATEGAVDPRVDYTARLNDRSLRLAHLAARDRMIGTIRLLVFLIGIVAAWLAIGRLVISPLWLAAPVGAFLGLIVHHDRVIKLWIRANRSVAFYQAGLSRIDDTWMGRGQSGERFLATPHPYAADLDLFGSASVFELLCTVRTRGGEETLAGWLKAPTPIADILERHAAVEELRPRVDLREEISLLGEDVRTGVHPEALAAWGAEPPRLHAPGLRRLAFALTALTLTGIVCDFTPIGSAPLVIALIAQGIFGWTVRSRVLHVVHALEQPSEDLKLLSEILERLEREPVSAARLVALRQQLETDGIPPYQHIAQLQRLVHLLDARKNQFFAPLAPVLLWTTHCVFAIEAWRSHIGPALSGWLAAVAEMEALCALAAYAYEHPEDPMPELVHGATVFDGEALGHPLLPIQRCVRNDVRLDQTRAVLVVSGSNMSGKSTLLRTVGTNAVLALAGAPVRARRLRLSSLALGASIRVQDSLHAGASRFYAEITRLRLLVDIAQSSPLLFLLDEILHGTNSHDRRIGGEAVVRGLVELGAIGLVTTHDLALAHIADALAPRAANVHFADHLENGHMAFDYRMQPGVVQKSNALELMRAVGLKV